MPHRLLVLFRLTLLPSSRSSSLPRSAPKPSRAGPTSPRPRCCYKDFTSVAFGNGVFLAIAGTPIPTSNGRYYAVGGAIRSAEDLTTWTTHRTPLAGSFSYRDIAYGNGRFLGTTNGAGGTVTSNDGTT